MGLTDEQFEARRSFLGGSDMAALAGLSPYAGPIDVWRDKVEQRQQQTSTPMMATGTLLEPVVARLFEIATGVKLRRPAAMIHDKARPYLGGNVDRWAGTDGVFEAKWGIAKRAWGEAGSADVPPHVAIQLQHYLGVTGRPRGYVGALIGYADFRWYDVPRDDDLIADLREIGRVFWFENVLPGIPPEPDGSQTYQEFISARWPSSDGPEVVATAAQAAWADQYREAQARLLRATRDLGEIRQRIQTSMAGASKLLLPERDAITWRSYEQKAIDWPAVARLLAPDEAALDAAVKANTTTDQRRPFRTPQSWTNEEAVDE